MEEKKKIKKHNFLRER